jgi:hypothetical protein
VVRLREGVAQFYEWVAPEVIMQGMAQNASDMGEFENFTEVAPRMATLVVG